MTPTHKPTTSFPTESPSHSPTQHPIIYTDFYHSVNAFFRITGWTHSEISNVNDDIHLFGTSLTHYIHQGFDEDLHLEYRDIILNISTLNDYSYDKLFEGDYSTVNETLMQSVNNGMRLQYLIECSDVFACEYIAGESSTIELDRSSVESSVTAKLHNYFSLLEVSGDAANSTLSFTIENITANTDALESNEDSNEFSVFILILYIFVALCLFISGISIGVILYHRKRHSSTAVVSKGPNRNPGESKSVAGGSRMSISTPRDGIEMLQRFTSNYNAEGQEGIPATGVVSANDDEEIPHQGNETNDGLNQHSDESESSRDIVNSGGTER